VTLILGLCLTFFETLFVLPACTATITWERERVYVCEREKG
jgi:hypothetical protein